MITIVEILIALSAIIGIAAYFGDKLSKNAASKATELLVGMEEHYLNFLEKQKTLFLLSAKQHLQDNTEEISMTAVELTPEQLQTTIDELFVIIKPEIDALIGHINATNLSDVKMQSNSRFFRNVAHIAESFYEKRKNSKEPLTERDEEKMYSAVKDAIRSDLKERIVNWQLGNMT
jgi:hypothetical protein